ncbi:hypothetical protein TNCV_4066161 [Trichonephila clavipes]|uniref:Uncharacterized protein n=1 Tax=Trichonephila clavipes TaxID=2585209 RepID=A0A8X6W9R4_TRICX|nr:hypothetical protein TNCV_4066161 [Trichonephila clavipes]
MQIRSDIVYLFESRLLYALRCSEASSCVNSNFKTLLRAICRTFSSETFLDSNSCCPPSRREGMKVARQTDHPSKTIAKHVPERQNFHTSQIPGPSTRNVPCIPPTHTPNAACLSRRNELYIPISYSDYNADIQANILLQVNYVPQLDDPIMVNYATNPQNIFSRNAHNNIQNMCSQHNLSVQTYPSFQQNSTAHREYKKYFLKMILAMFVTFEIDCGSKKI